MQRQGGSSLPPCTTGDEPRRRGLDPRGAGCTSPARTMCPATSTSTSKACRRWPTRTAMLSLFHATAGCSCASPRPPRDDMHQRLKLLANPCGAAASCRNSVQILSQQLEMPERSVTYKPPSREAFCVRSLHQRHINTRHENRQPTASADIQRHCAGWMTLTVRVLLLPTVGPGAVQTWCGSSA